MYYKLIKDLPGAKAGTIFNCPEKVELTHNYHIGLSGVTLGEPEEDTYFVSRSYVKEFPDFFEEYTPSKKWKIGEKCSTNSDYDKETLYFGVINGILLPVDGKHTRYNVSFLGSSETIHESYLRVPTSYELTNFFI